MDTMTLKFEGVKYEIPIAATIYAGDAVRLPDGRFVELVCIETYPPQVQEVVIVDGPTDVREHKGKAWEATIVE